MVTYNGYNNYGDGATDICIDYLLSVYVTGSSRNATNSGWEAATIKYNQPIGVITNSNELPRQFKLNQNYPNPFNPRTIINYQLPISNFVKLIVYDILGREVTELVNSMQKAGFYEVEWDGSNLASGVYLYKIEAGTFVDSKKMVLVK